MGLSSASELFPYDLDHSKIYLNRKVLVMVIMTVGVMEMMVKRQYDLCFYFAFCTLIICCRTFTMLMVSPIWTEN
jgi:hypothetical protein